MAEHNQHPPVSGQAKQVGSVADDVSIPAARREPDTNSASWYRRLWKWAVTNPEKAGNLTLGLGALATAAVSVIVAILSLYVASQALNDQTASDQADRDVQIQSFASKISLVGTSPTGVGPLTMFFIENLNNQPLASMAIVIGVKANVQFSNDGLAYTAAISWRNAYSVNGMGPCSQYTFNINGASNRGASSYSGLIFFDNDDRAWYREGGGLLVQVLLEPAQESNLRGELEDVPPFLRTDYSYRTLTGCS